MRLVRFQVFKEIFGVGLNMLEPLTAFFGVCRVPQGGGLYTSGSFLQEAESTVTFENCTRASVAFGSPLGNGAWGS